MTKYWVTAGNQCVGEKALNQTQHGYHLCCQLQAATWGNVKSTDY